MESFLYNLSLKCIIPLIPDGLILQGKLLALDLIVKVLESPQQHWDNIRAEFSEQLRQPLCLALLRNCMSPYDEAYALATRLFTAIILQVTPQLKAYTLDF